MSLTDELAAQMDGRSAGSNCSFMDLYGRLDPTTVTELREALGNVTIPSTVIADVLKRRGHEISCDTVQRHRRQGRGNGCRCDTL